VKLIIILCSFFFASITTVSIAAELTNEQFKKGYVAYDIINGEIMLIQFMVEKCNDHDKELARMGSVTNENHLDLSPTPLNRAIP